MIDARMMFVSLAPLHIIKLGFPVAKGTCPLNLFNIDLLNFVAPIELKKNDMLWLNWRSHQLEIIERNSVIIWRANLQN